MGGSTFCLLILFITCESVPMFNTGALYFMDLPSMAEYNNQSLQGIQRSPLQKEFLKSWRANIGIKPPAPRIVDVNENDRGNMRSPNLRQKLQSMMIKHLSGRNSVWSKRYKNYGSNLESKRNFKPYDDTKVHFFRVH